MDTVEHRSQDAPAFIERALSHLAALGMRVGWSGHADEYGQAVSGTLTIQDGGQPHTFSAIASPSNTKADVAMFPHGRDTVLISERVTQTRAQQLKDRGWGGYVDSSGNASLRGDGLVIEITGQSNSRSAQQSTATAPFTRTGLPVTFSLLAANEHFGITPSQRALADSSGASLGTVNRVIRALRERTPSFLEGKHNELLRRSALEHEWISAYSAMQPTAWPEERFTSDIWKKPSDLLDVSLPPAALFGSEIAAARLGAPIRPASVLIHLSGNAGDRRELIRQGRLRKDEQGMIRIRPALCKNPPVPSNNRTAPRLLVRADLLLEDDPRIDEIRTQFFGDDR
ncbi:MAG: hypothetical protein L0J17_13150 [Brevibacterium sp.]|uniref:type IV toxin-antitoxin system AbiEi family antitoxin n=1 Tax=Brevibacterium sp. TaxID=1701 RepID=UPI002649397D|nr:type IV toxin-antitoxin system AbiEi family antitoxin [Brevibacterium sp.]MDN5808075.1 hypothetical protein [Brevibacterium sp.]MDN5834585.1 hypothetical protein [Brevibacterium sp.]MDN5877401.1 hypothetical protein [Brevibacterium sp.]MDN5910545.1 hypothetical protein [Brevibacterium sp.]MDN6134428.1 hypothetical protein [Brevibacterium sp.]